MLGLIGNKFALEGPFWRIVGEANHHFGAMGYAIVGAFALSWLLSFAIFRLKGYDRIKTGA